MQSLAPPPWLDHILHCMPVSYGECWASSAGTFRNLSPHGFVSVLKVAFIFSHFATFVEANDASPQLVVEVVFPGHLERIYGGFALQPDDALKLPISAARGTDDPSWLGLSSDCA